MEAYKIKIELLDADPAIWREVVMPADATFKRLHDVIQNTTNFLGGYPSDGYHLYKFDLVKNNILVTNDEEAYVEHKHFMKNRKVMEKEMREQVLPEHEKFVQRRLQSLQTVVRKPTGLKIDDYLQKYGELLYTYDFGDDWRFLITLESIREDYPYGYPTLLDGAGTAPPEDVGGLLGFASFLKKYHDQKDPDHDDVVQWAEMQQYREYDKTQINSRLKGIKYKKTEWT